MYVCAIDQFNFVSTMLWLFALATFNIHWQQLHSQNLIFTLSVLPGLHFTLVWSRLQHAMPSVDVV